MKTFVILTDLAWPYFDGLDRTSSDALAGFFRLVIPPVGDFVCNCRNTFCMLIWFGLVENKWLLWGSLTRNYVISECIVGNLFVMFLLHANVMVSYGLFILLLHNKERTKNSLFMSKQKTHNHKKKLNRRRNKKLHITK